VNVISGQRRTDTVICNTLLKQQASKCMRYGSHSFSVTTVQILLKLFKIWQSCSQIQTSMVYGPESKCSFFAHFGRRGQFHYSYTQHSFVTKQYEAVNKPYQQNAGTNCWYKMMKYPPAFDPIHIQHRHLVHGSENHDSWTKCGQEIYLCSMHQWN